MQRYFKLRQTTSHLSNHIISNTSSRRRRTYFTCNINHYNTQQQQQVELQQGNFETTTIITRRTRRKRITKMDCINVDEPLVVKNGSPVSLPTTISFLEAMSLNSSEPTTSTTTASNTTSGNDNKNKYTNKQQQKNNNTRSPNTSSPKKSSSVQPLVGLSDVLTQYKLTEKDVQTFMYTDTMNNGNQIEGVSLKSNGDFIIMRLNGIDLVNSQYIHVAPKLKKYYSTAIPSTITFKKYYIANKWNGMNIQIYKYKDNQGKIYLSAKPRVASTLSNDKKGNALELVQRILKDPSLVPSQYNQLLIDESSRSMVFELCGTLSPHIVKYDFEIQLKPLYEMKQDGSIYPIIEKIDDLEIVSLDEAISIDKLQEKVNEIKSRLYETNKLYRTTNNLSENMYWYNHFKEEGRVLYVLDQDGKQLVNESILAIKPIDCDKFHWEQFDQGIQTKVLIISHELREKGSPITKETLKRELELDEYTWNKWEEDILDLAILPEFNSIKSKKKQSSKRIQQSSPSTSSSIDEEQVISTDKSPISDEETNTIDSNIKRMIITVGFPASGKSYFAQKLTESSKWKRVNQDEMGTRKKCEDALSALLKSGESVIVDRCNFDIPQRRVWLKLALSHGVSQIHVLWFKIDSDTCKKRIVVRENHPTIPKGNEGIEIINKFESMFVSPQKYEGFNDIQIINNEEESNQFIEKFINLI